MVFSDLKKLVEKENRLFLILVILLIIGFTFAQFGLLGYGYLHGINHRRADFSNRFKTLVS